MSKTHYSDVATLLSDIRFYGASKQNWQPLLSKHDLAFALADLMRFDYVEPTSSGWSMIDECWDATCEFLGIDPYEEYANANEMVINFDGGYFD